MHEEAPTREELIVPNFSTISIIDMDLQQNIMYAARIRANPFSVIGFEHYHMKSFDFTSGEDLDGVGWVMQHVSRWRELDTGSDVLIPEHISLLPWSQMFMCYARKVGVANKKEIVSMCGPISNKYYLTPIDKTVKLYRISSEDSIKKKLLSNPVPREAAATVPFKDMWDWQTALIVAHMYCWGMMEAGYEANGRDMIFF